VNVETIKKTLNDWNDSRQVYVRILNGPDKGAVHKIHSIKKDHLDRLCINVRG